VAGQWGSWLFATPRQLGFHSVPYFFFFIHFAVPPAVDSLFTFNGSYFKSTHLAVLTKMP
jgi:hypothetical protein